MIYHEIKLIEIRDRSTCIPAAIFRLDCSDWLAQRAGWHKDNNSNCYLVDLLGRRRAEYDPYAWGDRTFHNVLKWCKNNFDSIENGQVVDVEYILGETDQPKTSERYLGRPDV